MALATAHGELRERHGFLVHIDEGTGEACPLPSLGTEDVASCARALEATAEALRRLPPPETVEDIRLPAPLDEAPAARHGIELALLDLVAQRRGVPVRALLTPRPADDVPVSALLNAREPA
ncbi:MAG TPA: o-succinylbenzoate synthase, partial [Myxococcales bacterium]|nr:o-succinylbenzoate synthase [Myxococcales bacterium]